ncbi:hypothetical protein VW29_05045 [Devosia limi DSM 17137]|uniref:Predicted kinase, aminoglycoside phosphotransferase (APT) family n=1 Tax=Devosia limi DSM 17137 TaxID=1121477 RepID=A0A0F5LWD4_9HYPH|nr:phosphotransferase [Devosia limi]KKB85972.1 hypothetical protein VW29_05045 [Devosia limi DSM 17137]SHF00026.1 Predicted kinase, aminoglycoside phosphotransferase (APT) family [Devosia limi DSM 17137]
MTDDRIEISADDVQALVAAQFPHWAHLPVRPVLQGGWDNRTFHLGERMKVRLPSAQRYVAAVEKENRYLPGLAAQLPLPIPVPLAIGSPGQGYPYIWSVYDWLEGETASAQRIADMAGFAADLGEFLVALQAIDASDGPPAGEHNFHRGGALSVYDGETRACIAALGERIDGAAALAVWEAALAATWHGRPVWVHGDIAAGNLLVRDGHLAAVIDFGSSAVGDPACDLVIAWLLFSGESRSAFRRAVAADEAVWARARGWALWKALLVMAEDRNTPPAELPAAAIVETVLAEHRLAR